MTKGIAQTSARRRFADQALREALLCKPYRLPVVFNRIGHKMISNDAVVARKQKNQCASNCSTVAAVAKISAFFNVVLQILASHRVRRL